MRLSIALATCGLFVAACGGGIDSFEEGTDAYVEVMQEMVSVLEDVDDESSAETAAAKIEKLGDRLTEIKAQMDKLPRPTAEEIQKMAEKQRASQQAFQQDAAAQMMKMAQYPVLMEAWMRAMGNMQ